MKIALVNTLYAPYQVGGAERAVQILAESLAGRGHQVCVATLGEGGCEGRGEVNGVAVRRVPLANGHWPYAGPVAHPARRALWHVNDLHNATMARRLGEVLDEEEPDVVHTNNLAGFSVAAWGEAERRGIPVIHTLHDYYLMCPPSVMYRKAGNCAQPCGRCRPFAAYRRHASAAVRKVVGVSGFILERHVRGGFFPRARGAQVVFNTASPRAARAPKPDAPATFGFIGRVCEGKGVRWLLEAFSRHALPGERLLVAGRGDPAYVAGLEGRFGSAAVSFLGHTDADAFYARVDILVVPSLWHEPFGRTVIEALAHGVPVIATTRGGIPEIIDDGVTGVLVDPDEPDSLGRAMRRLAGEPARARGLGLRGAGGIARFSEQAAVEAYEAAYVGLAA